MLPLSCTDERAPFKHEKLKVEEEALELVLA